MAAVTSVPESTRRTLSISEADDQNRSPNHMPLVSILLPAFNEAMIIEENLTRLCRHMESLETQYRWEIIVVNDGSRDETGALAEQFSKSNSNIHVLHHVKNYGLGQALKSGFNQCRGDYIVVLDLDLSYSPDHIEKLLARIRQTRAKVVVTSPYTKGGLVSNVPWLRRTLSVWANRFLSQAANCNVSTLTGMVRVYDGRFIKSLDLKSVGMEVNPEIIYKGLLLKARIEEIPAHLDWKLQQTVGPRRKSSMKVMRHIFSTLLSGFLFKPVMCFILPGLGLLLFAIYVNAWILLHFLREYRALSQYDWFFDRASVAVAQAYQAFPHTFIVGGLSLTLAIQLISLGILSLQSKQYFEEIFHLGSSIYKSIRDQERRASHE